MRQTMAGALVVMAFLTGAAAARAEEPVRVRLVEPRPIYVLGAVDRPGHYTYQAGMTVADALDAAGARSHGLAVGRVRIRAGGSNVRPVPADPAMRAGPE